MGNVFSRVMEQLVYEQGRCRKLAYNNLEGLFVFNLGSVIISWCVKSLSSLLVLK